MMMLIEIGSFAKLVMPVADGAPLIERLVGARFVEEEGPYGARVYKAKAKDNVTFRIIQENEFVLDDSGEKASVEAIVKLSEEKSKLQSRVWEMERELKAIKEAAGVKP